jgi:hypothetical protein
MHESMNIKGQVFSRYYGFHPHLNHSTNAPDSDIHLSLILYFLAIDSAIQ